MTVDINTDEVRTTGYNTGLAKVAVQSSADTFVVNQSLVLHINICAENPHLRKAAKRYALFIKKTLNKLTYMTKRKIQLLLTFGMFMLMTFQISFNCYSQDSSRTIKILYIERTTLESNQTHPTHKIFRIGNKIKINRYSNDTILRGKIESIGDTSIILQSKIVALNDIKCIKKSGGNIMFVIGALTPIAGTIIGSATSPNNDFDRAIGTYVGLIYGVLVGVVIEMVGVMSIVAERKFHLDKDYIMTIKTVKKKI